ncbi:MAG: HsdR family type I site-specific deoxyribonuclease [Mariprofundaceae bacterium]|nr:HsdR family type I site-specific deoxyribonuclease [Mariprofundaceae bacterium]
MYKLPKTQEQYSSHIPALHILAALGYKYLTPHRCLAKRGGTNSVLLKDVLVETLKTRTFEYKGNTYPLSSNAIDQIVREFESPQMNEGLMIANEKLYDKMTLGVTVTEFVGGNRYQPTVKMIDWENPANNQCHFTEEFVVSNTLNTSTRRPDVVCFINGIPVVVIEAKRPDSSNPNKDMLDEGISQMIRNQKDNEIPHLFAYSQLLLSINGLDGRYGTTKTAKKFWAKWTDEDLTDADYDTIKNNSLNHEQQAVLLQGREPWVRRHFESLWSQSMAVTGQDKLLISLLKPERLLEFMRYFILFDKRNGKIAARYQQVFGIKRLIERVNTKNDKGAREGGVIWHTTGSGKSFTMVFLCKAMLLHPSLNKARFIIVTDRIDLEKQLNTTFLMSGAFGSHIATKRVGEHSKVSSGKDLAKRIGQGTERIIFSIINKFTTAAKQPACRNDSSDLIVLIDEGHRSQGGESHERMRKALPNAAYIAFTGTPLLKNDKTENKFGSIIHAYTMKRAVADGAVTPLLYEERMPELNVNQKAIDHWFDKITNQLSEKQRIDLKKKFTSRGTVYGSQNRIELIAWDIATHYSTHIKSTGLKAQLATDSKLSAIRYKKALDATGLVGSAVVISAPDTREGHTDVDEATLPDVQQWWKDNVGSQAEEEYTQSVISSFADDDEPDILIVVSKLLTGFDEPRNGVLYIDKKLEAHNLIQAIARVNRLHDAKKYGLLIDYRGILKSLDTAIKDYQDLEEATQDGFDIDDIDGMYTQINTEYKRLPKLHDTLWSGFDDVKNRADLEQYRQLLIPKLKMDSQGLEYDSNQKHREDFYEALTEFGMCLKIALSSSGFFEDASFTENDIQGYKDDLRFFVNLRKICKQDAQETIDYSVYEQQIGKLIDQHVIGEGIKEPEGAYLVNDLGQSKPETWSEEKTRNETDLIRTRAKKTIEEKMEDDPYAKEYFSKLLKKAIGEAESLFDYPLKQYALFKKFDDDMKARKVEGIPKELENKPHAKAYYGAIKLVLGTDVDAVLSTDKKQTFIELAMEMDAVVHRAIAENSINPQNIESEIQKSLLPRLFKDLGGLDLGKSVLAHVIQIVRHGNR